MSRLLLTAAATVVLLAVAPLKAAGTDAAYPPDSVLRSLGITNQDVDSLITNGIPSSQGQGNGILSGGHDPDREDHGDYRHRDRFAWYWLLPLEWREILCWRFEHRRSRQVWHWAPFVGWYCTTEWYWDDDNPWDWGPPRGPRWNWDWDHGRGHDRKSDHDRGGDRNRRHDRDGEGGDGNDHRGRHH